jgi:SAM-dependent methyltransferase
MNVKDRVMQKYSRAALRVSERGTAHDGPNPPTGIAQAGRALHEIYAAEEAREIPAKAIAASLGCGNPVTLARLTSGEIALDLGSGGGADVFLAAQRVGPTGKVYGLDMSDEMLVLARENQREAGIENVEFLKGEIEDVPLPEGSVDVVISNCVINLSVDKSRVLKEAFRVLKPGGRFAVSDVVLCGEIPASLRTNPDLWAGCLAGAMQDAEYRSALAAAGFVDVDIEPTRVFRAAEVREFLRTAGPETASLADLLDGKVMSASVRAAKPH